MIQRAYKSFRTLIPLVFIFSTYSQASQYSGRITTGGYVSEEKFNEKSADGSTRNDFSTVSNRVFLNVYDIGAYRNNLVADLRDKHDFFDKLDREKLALTSSNSFQARQLSYGFPNENSRFYSNVGRFSVLQAGGIYTDGAEAGYRLNPVFSSGVFGGLNPKRDDLSYLTFQKNSRVAGLYATYDPHKQTWGNYTYLTSGLTVKEYEGLIDRILFFHNSTFQWGRNDRWVNVLFLDTAPSFRVQNLSSSFKHFVSKSTSATARITAFDSVEYLRRQSLRERLPSSQYQEAEVGAEYDSANANNYGLNVSHGIRHADKKTKTEARLSANSHLLFSRYLSVSGAAGYRKNFDSNDTFGRAGLGIFSKNWELSLSEEIADEKYTSGATLTPWTTELSAAHFFSKEVYGTLSFQYATDQNVNITSGFLKVSYRFGSEGVPPLREGATPQAGGT